MCGYDHCNGADRGCDAVNGIVYTIYSGLIYKCY